ncbi:transposase, partial [Alkalibacterium sp. s-m-22]
LYRVLKKKRGRAKIKASVVVSLGLNDNNEDIQAKIIFVRDNRRGKKNWLALLSTDVDLPDEEIIRLYGKRWQIETFFKYSK